MNKRLASHEGTLFDGWVSVVSDEAQDLPAKTNAVCASGVWRLSDAFRHRKRADTDGAPYLLFAVFIGPANTSDPGFGTGWLRQYDLR